MAIVRELITRFGFNVDQTGVNRVEGSINRLSGMLSGLAAFASLRALAGVADSMQSLEARIGMLPQTIGNVGDAFNEVSKHASDNRQSLEAYGSFYTKVGQAAKGLIKDQDQLLKVTDTISQALVVGGANTVEAKAAMLQFGQALGSGVLQGDEFRSMAESAPQYLDALAESMKIPREQLKKMASDGKLTSKAVIEATLKMSTMFEEKFRKMPMTIGAATTIIGNKFSTMIAGLNRESQAVTSIANFLLNGFDRIEQGAKSFITFVGGSKNALKSFGIALFALFGPMALGGFIGLLGVVFSLGGLVVAGLVLLGLAVDDIITYLDGGQSLFGDFIQWMSDGSVGASVLAGALIAVASAITANLAVALVGLSARFISTIALSYALSGSLFALVANFAMLAAASIATGISMAAAWVIGLAPLTLGIIAIAAIGTAVYALWANWDKVMGWMGEKVKWVIDKAKQLGEFFGIGSAPGPGIPSVAPSSVAKSAASGGNTNMTSNQTVNLTVPPGTPESQQAYLKGAAGVLQSESPEQKWARDISMLGL